MTSISRGFGGRRRDDVDPSRIPPGQYYERGFPVLSAGPTPRTALEEWTFTIQGAVDEARSWTWAELTALAAEDGEVSPYLVDDVIAGDQFDVRGPIGGPFTRSVDEGGPLYLIGGGSGMVPLMAMLRHRAAHPDAQIPAHVLVSHRSATTALYTTEMETLTPRERLHVARTYTRQAPNGWRGWTRRVDDAMLRAAGPSDDAARAAARVFVCGPAPFVGTVTRLLVDQGYDPLAIRAEEFGATS